MKAAILAAGMGKRLHPLTVTRPKPLLYTCGKSILENTIDELSRIKEIDEIIVVIGYLAEMVEERLKGAKGKKIRFVRQKEISGSGTALMECKSLLGDDFLVLNGDDVYSSEDIRGLLKHRHAILVKKVDDSSRFGLVEHKGMVMQKISEKPKGGTPGYVNIGVYKLTKDIFGLSLPRSDRGEYELPDFLTYIKGKGEQVHLVEAKTWIPLTYPWNLFDVNDHIMKGMKWKVEGEVEKLVTIKGDVHVGKGTIVKNGSYIEGPVYIGEDCVIGPNCYIRAGTSIGNRCKIGNAVEIKNSIIMDGTNVGHLSYVGDSIIGEGSNFGAGTKVANLRHDGKSISTPVSGKMVDTGRRKLGTIVGDSVHTGINTSIYPGRKLWPHTQTLPGEIVSKDKNG